jgi:hypothetical protein
MSRRRLLGGAGSVMAAVITFRPEREVIAAEGPFSKRRGGRSPEVMLIDEYCAWFAIAYADVGGMPEGLVNYISDSTVFREASSLPWGGKYIGFAGWAALRDKGRAALGNAIDMSAAQYWQRDNIVLREYMLTLEPMKPGAMAPPAIKIEV